MAAPIFLYRVFLASPSDLVSERRAIVGALDEYNKQEALNSGIMFYPVRWEDAAPAMGRPQSHLNAKLRQCDFFFLTLWKRWGSPPDSGASVFSSGTEEEYAEAKACCHNDQLPMRDVAVAFKDVDDGSLADPGEQLSAVLRFKRRLTDSKEVFYSTFACEVDLQRVVRACLADWTRRIMIDRSAPRLDPSVNAVQYSGDRLSLNFQGIEVRAILQLLADFTGLNLVVSDTVGGTVTLRLKNVPWDQALDIILRTKGLSMRQTGDVIMIAPTSEIVAQEKLTLEEEIWRAEFGSRISGLRSPGEPVD